LIRIMGLLLLGANRHNRGAIASDRQLRQPPAAAAARG
jgi:hypothetical protein